MDGPSKSAEPRVLLAVWGSGRLFGKRAPARPRRKDNLKDTRGGAWCGAKWCRVVRARVGEEARRRGASRYRCLCVETAVHADECALMYTEGPYSPS